MYYLVLSTKYLREREWLTLKYGEHADKMTRCARMNCPSALSVTSTRDSSSSKLSKTENSVDLWLFHLRQNCCSVAVPMVINSGIGDLVFV